MLGAEQPTAETTNSIRLEIGGMHCASCVSKVEQALCEVEGVTAATVNLATGAALVEWSSAAQCPPQLVEAVEQAGFSAAVSHAQSPRSIEQRMDAESAGWLRRLITAAMILLFMLAAHFWRPVGAEISGVYAWVTLGLAGIIQFYVGWPYLQGALNRLRHGDVNMDTLVSVGTLTAFGSGVAEFAAGHGGMRWIDAAMILTFVTLGKYLESRTARAASSALREMMQLAPDRANVLSDGQVVEQPARSVRVGDRILIRAGDRIPLDARVTEGNSTVDESWLTGEPIDIEKRVGDDLLAGSINQQGVLTAEVVRQAADTTLAQVLRLVEQTQSSKAEVQRLADRIVTWFVPLVLTIAFVAFLLWWLAAGNLSQAITSAVAVLVVACPCAMGLATPTAILVGSSRAADLGILFRDASAIERTASVDTVVFDKTGTLTRGKPTVTRIQSVDGMEQSEWFSLAAAAESQSTHPLAHTIVEQAHQQALPILVPSDHKTIAGRGVHARVDSQEVLVGNETLMNTAGITVSTLETTADATQIYVAVNKSLVGAILVQDQLRRETDELIGQLHQAGIQTALLSGDRRVVVKSVAEQLGIDQFFADVMPGEKAVKIQRMQGSGRTVAMVGDGINDAVALAAADVGVSLRSGSDVAIESADMVIFRDSLLCLTVGLGLARATVRTIWQNLFWAFGYNAILIPVAGGLLVPLGLGQLPPVAAAAAMAASSVSVVLNSLRLRSCSVQLAASR